MCLSLSFGICAGIKRAGSKNTMFQILGPKFLGIKCHCWTYDDNISLKLKKPSFAIFGGILFYIFSNILLYLSGLNMMVTILNKEKLP